MHYLFPKYAIALAVLAVCTSVADAKTFKVHFHNEKTLKALCARGGGKFNSGEASYSCTYKNGNIRECSREQKKCIVETPPKREVAQPGGVGAVPTGGGILDPGPSLGMQGPSATGTPLAPAAPAGRPGMIK